MDGDGKNWIRAWENHMVAIESLASANYHAGKALVDGKVLVDTLELTPRKSRHRISKPSFQ